MSDKCEHGLPRGCCAVCPSRTQREYEGLAAFTGRSIEELEADLTAPDPAFDGHDWEPGDFADLGFSLEVTE